MPSIRKISTFGVLEVFVKAEELVSLVDGDIFRDSIIAVSPSGEEIAMPFSSSTPSAGNAAVISLKANFDLTARTDWEPGVFEIFAESDIQNTSGISIPERKKLQDVRINIINPLRPIAELQSLTPITSAATSYEFDAVFSDDGVLDASSITTNNILITGPNGFSKEPDALISKTPSTDAQTITARYRVDGTFNATNNGVYLVEALPGAVTDTGSRGNVRNPIGTFAVAIADDVATVGTVTSFAGLSSLPAGWISHTDEVSWLPDSDISFLPNGVLIPKEGENNFYGHWLRSPVISFVDGTEVQIDMLAESFDSQLGVTGEKRDFNVTDQTPWANNGLLWADDGNPQPKPIRLRWSVNNGIVTKTYSHDLGGGYAVFSEVSAPVDTNVPSDRRIYIDGITENLIVTEVTIKNA